MADSWLLTGLLSAVLVMLPRWLWQGFPNAHWNNPYLLIIPCAIGLFFWRALKRHDGLADLHLHVHAPQSLDTASAWGLRAVCSFLFALFGAPVGPEGPAIAATQAALLQSRNRSARWSEQRRRTDASSALAAGIAAAFGAPFAGVLLAVELGLGGRFLTAALSALTAFAAIRILPVAARDTFDLTASVYGFRFDHWQHWVASAGVAVVCAIFGVIFLLLLRYFQARMSDLVPRYPAARVILGISLIVVLGFIYRPAHESPHLLLEQIVWGRKSASAAGLTLLISTLGILLILSGVGTLGVFWPVFAVGGMAGYLLQLGPLHFAPGFAGAAALLGGATMWGAVIGAPLSAAVLISEMTQNPFLLLPGYACAWTAVRLRQRLKVLSLHEGDLVRKGVKLLFGRSAPVLESILVREAWVTDFETIREHEAVAEIHAQLLRSKYPFLPVINAQGLYIGLLTVDVVEEAWRREDPNTANSPLSKLLEAKDLLYRAGQKPPQVKPDDTLAATVAYLDAHPCIPVVEDRKIVGLVFNHHVRLVYDREVARRSLQK